MATTSDKKFRVPKGTSLTTLVPNGPTSQRATRIVKGDVITGLRLPLAYATDRTTDIRPNFLAFAKTYSDESRELAKLPATPENDQKILDFLRGLPSSVVSQSVSHGETTFSHKVSPDKVCWRVQGGFAYALLSDLEEVL